MVKIVKHKNYIDFFNISNKCLSAVNAWCVNNNLQLNFDKSKYVFFNITNISHFENNDFSLCANNFNCRYLNELSNCIPLKKSIYY